MTDESYPTDPVQAFAGSNLAALKRQLARIRAKQAAAQEAGRYLPDPPKAGQPPRWRSALAQSMPYPEARLEHLDGPIARDVGRWLDSLTGAQQALDDPGPGNALFLGPAGSGKTVAVCAIGTHLADLGWRVGYARVSDLLADERPDGTHRLRGDFARCDVVILDDFFASGMTDWAVDTITDIVDQLVHPSGGSDPVYLVVTSNSPVATLSVVVPDRLWSRLASDAWVFQIVEDDRRGETLRDLGVPPKGECPHGCEGGWLFVAPEQAEAIAGPEPSGSRSAAAGNSVRPCPFCRGRRASSEGEEQEAPAPKRRSRR